MAKENLPFPDAARKLAAAHGISIKDESLTDEQRIRSQHQESLYVVNTLAGAFFKKSLRQPENKAVIDYALSRWSLETIERFEIGYAPDSWSGLLDHARKAGIKTEILLEAGLIKESTKSDGKLYDFFRNRLVIPIHDKYGRIIGFTARALTADQKPKYLNTQETAVFHKGRTLFGLSWALGAIKEKGFAYLVEGNADVIRLHELGIHETVGSSGTALSLDQIQEIRKYCSSITLIGDTDLAGKNAMDRSAKLIIGEGMNCNVVRLPNEKGVKQDPDSFFKDPDQFDQYVRENQKDYIIDLAERWQEKARSTDFKMRAIEEISSLIGHFNTKTQTVYIDQVSKLIKPKKAWQDQLKELSKDTQEDRKEGSYQKIPSHVKLTDWDRYGFYEDKNCYHFNTRQGIVRGCNFTLKPLFHIKSVQNAKRLFRITNEYGATEVIELAQRDLVSLARFKECVESLGNFLWEASESELNKLKRFLYEETQTCVEITQLGWHKDQFFAWGNGIYNAEFSKVDDNGIVRHGEINYYLPAFSKIYAGESGLFINERQFIHRQGNPITLRSYSEKLIGVFGNNAAIALCFYLASLFRDIIVSRFGFFPILDLFGPKGAGKTELAVSLMSFFGKQGKGPNINNTTKAALADHVAAVANACVHIDEYKNNIEPEKIEFLKGLWDGTGRTRMNMDKDKKKETTAVDCGIILSGQEMPTADIALFSRLIYLTFSTSEYDDEAKIRFNELKQIEKLGNTHITNQILSHRGHFVTHFADSYDKVATDLNLALGDTIIEDRIFRNWLLILASYHTLKDRIQLSFTYPDLITLAASQIQVQNSETKRSGEVSGFWKMVEFLYSDGLIQQGVDFKVECLSMLQTDKTSAHFDKAVNVLFVQMSRIFLLYRKHGKSAGEKVLPVDSIDYYLRTDKRYLGKKRTRFKFIDPLQEQPNPNQTKPQWAYCFEYDRLEITLHTDDGREDEPGRPSSSDNTLPF
jgi:DNA primase catalytic core